MPENSSSFCFCSWLWLVFIQFIIILLFWEFFPPALADGFPLESKWQQFSSSLGDDSQYSGRSQHCYIYNGLHSSSSFQILQHVNYHWCQFWGGARGVMVIVAGIGHGNTSSNPGLIAFHIALIPLGKVWIQLFSLQLWVNSRAD